MNFSKPSIFCITSLFQIGMNHAFGNENHVTGFDVVSLFADGNHRVDIQS